MFLVLFPIIIVGYGMTTNIDKIINDCSVFAQIIAERLDTASGQMSVRLPKSVHAALLAEAELEGVSLNKLCVAKLCMQLRALL